MTAIVERDPVCVLDATGFCQRHGKRHWAEGRRLALEDSEAGATFRRLHDKFARGEMLDPLRVPQRFQLHVGAHGPDTRSVWPLGYGPGTELAAMLKAIGVAGWEGCQCASRVDEMDRWGVEGCRKNRALIVKWLQDASAKVMGLKPNDVGDWGPMVDEAISQAEAKAPRAPPPTLAELANATGAVSSVISLE